MCDCANRTFFALRCYQSKLSPAIIKVFVHILKFSPAKIHKATFLLSYFSMTKSTKSHQRERSPLFENSSRVHELVARAVRGECVRHGINRKSRFCHSTQLHTTTRANISHEKAEQIRARIVCTPAYKGAAGVGLVPARTGFPKQTLISPCSHTDAHPNLNREVRHSPTWHSSESESALERFEPVKL